MSWLKRHAVLVWPALVLAGVGLVVLVRVGSEWVDRPLTSPAAAGHGVVTAQPDAMATARRIRLLRDEEAKTREQLAAVQTQTALRQERIATLDEMLTSDSLTDCPPFLRQETTVRALQKIIREASDGPAGGDQNRLNTAATVAHERLRQKLEVLRSQLVQELGNLEARSETLRQCLRLQTEELELLERQIRRQSQTKALRMLTRDA
jgi:hypothetical protein